MRVEFKSVLDLYLQGLLCMPAGLPGAGGLCLYPIQKQEEHARQGRHWLTAHRGTRPPVCSVGLCLGKGATWDHSGPLPNSCLVLQGRAELWGRGAWAGPGEPGAFITGWDSSSVEEAATLFRPGIFFFSSLCWPGWLFPRLHFHPRAPPDWLGVGTALPHTQQQGRLALGFLPLSGQADWRKTALKPSSKQETALPAS